MLHPRRFLPLLLAFASVAGTAAAQSYWAVDADAVLTRENGSVTTVDVSGGFVHHSLANGPCGQSRRYAIGNDGDVDLVQVMDMCEGWIDPDGYTLDPPLTLVDQLLAPGKTWSQDTTLIPMWGFDTWPVHVEGTVLGPTQVTVPAGTFDVITVQVVITSASWQLPSETRTYQLQANLGDVTGLVSWQGVVPDETSSWGGVKALYR